MSKCPVLSGAQSQTLIDLLSGHYSTKQKITPPVSIPYVGPVVVYVKDNRGEHIIFMPRSTSYTFYFRDGVGSSYIRNDMNRDGYFNFTFNVPGGEVSIQEAYILYPTGTSDLVVGSGT